MRVIRTPAYRFMLALVAGLAALACPAIEESSAQATKPSVPIQFSFDRPLEASMAPFVVAASRGLFAAEGVSIANNFAQGSPDAIASVASGASEFAVVDINALAAGDAGQIAFDDNGLRLGALVRMADAADHDAIKRAYPILHVAVFDAQEGQSELIALTRGRRAQIRYQHGWHLLSSFCPGGARVRGSCAEGTMPSGS